MFKRVLKMVVGLLGGWLTLVYIDMFKINLADEYIYSALICFAVFLGFFVKTIREPKPKLTREGRRREKEYKKAHQPIKKIKKSKPKTKVIFNNRNTMQKHKQDFTSGHVECMWEELNK